MNRDRRVFAINIIEKEGENRWRLGGRAYETLHVGRSYLTCDPSQKVENCSQFLLLKIILYGHEIEQIEAVLTAWLIVEGEYKDQPATTENELLYNHYLYALE